MDKQAVTLTSTSKHTLPVDSSVPAPTRVCCEDAAAVRLAVGGTAFSIAAMASAADLVVVTVRPGCALSSELLKSLAALGLANKTVATPGSVALNNLLLTTDACLVVAVQGTDGDARAAAEESNMARTVFVADDSTMARALGVRAHEHPSISVVREDMEIVPVHRSPPVAGMMGDRALLSTLALSRARTETAAAQCVRIASSQPIRIDCADGVAHAPLPLELLMAIFDQLDLRSKMSAGVACRSWRVASRLSLRRDARTLSAAIVSLLPRAPGHVPHVHNGRIVGVALPAVRARWTPYGTFLSPTFRKSEDPRESHTVLLYPPGTTVVHRCVRELKGHVAALQHLLRCAGVQADLHEQAATARVIARDAVVANDPRAALSALGSAFDCIAAADALNGDAGGDRSLHVAVLLDAAAAHLALGGTTGASEAIRCATQCLMVDPTCTRAMLIRAAACDSAGDAAQSAANARGASAMLVGLS